MRRFRGLCFLGVAWVLLGTLVTSSIAHGPSPTPSLVPHSAVDASIPLSPGGNFPTYLGLTSRIDNGNEGGGSVNLTNAGSLYPLWNFTSGGTIAAQPIVVNGLVYVASWDGYEYALDATNGTVAWKTFLGLATGDTGCGSKAMGLTATPTYQSGVLYENGQLGGTTQLYALSAANGSILWNGSFGGTTAHGYYPWSSPTVFNGNVYEGIASQCDLPLVPAGLAEISLATHQQVAYFNSSAPQPNGASIWSTPSVNATSKTVFVTTGNANRKLSTGFSDSIIALNASSLKVRASWQVPIAQLVTDSDFGSSPALFTPPGGSALVSALNKNGLLYTWYQSNLTLKWQERISAGISISTPAYGAGRLYVEGPRTTIGTTTYNGSIRALNPISGHILWQMGLPRTPAGYESPLWFNGVLAVPDGPYLYVLKSATGSVLARTTVSDGSILPPPSYARSELLVGTGDRVEAFDLPLETSILSDDEGAETIAFAAQATGGLPPYAYNWSFGDGGFSSLPDPVHIYAGSGTYNVTLNVTDLAGRERTVLLADDASAPMRTGALPSGLTWIVARWS